MKNVLLNFIILIAVISFGCKAKIDINVDRRIAESALENLTDKQDKSEQAKNDQNNNENSNENNNEKQLILDNQEQLILETPILNYLNPTASSVVLNWNIIANAKEYLIYKAQYQQNTCQEFSKITNTTQTYFIDDTLIKDTQYCYKIKATNDNIESEFSNIVILTANLNYSLINTISSTQGTFKAAQNKSFYDQITKKQWVFYYNGTKIEYAYYDTTNSSWVVAGYIDSDTPDFAITYKMISDTSYCFLVYAHNFDIKLKRGIVGSDNITFESDIVVFDGSGIGNATIHTYKIPTIMVSSNNYLWIAAAHQDTIGYAPTVKKSINTATENLSSWTNFGILNIRTAIITDLALLENLEGNIYLISNEGGLLVYYFDGNTWMQITDGGEYAWFSIGNTEIKYNVNIIATQGDAVYLGGNFTQPGALPYQHRIVKWNGITFEEMGNSITGSSIYAIAVSGTDVYIGGSFSKVNWRKTDANNIAIWNGFMYYPLGSGTDGNVRSIIVDNQNENVYVGGEFNSAGGFAAQKIAKWNNTTQSWSALVDKDTNINGVNNKVNSLALVGTDLYVGGDFTTAGGYEAKYIAKWNGSKWIPIIYDLNNGTNGAVLALASYGNNLYVGGSFTQAGGISIERIVKYDTQTNQWIKLGTNTGGANNTVRTIVATQDYVYIGGDFTNVDGIGVSRIARYNTQNNTWQAIGGSSTTVYSLGLTKDALYLARARNSSSGAYAFMKYNFKTNTTEAIGTGYTDLVMSIASSGSNIYSVGYFFKVVSHSPYQYNIYMSKFNGTSWEVWPYHGAGAGSVPSILETKINSAEEGNDIYCGGGFTNIAGVSANRIARWNEKTNSWYALADGLNNSVYAIAFNNTDVYVGGIFTSAINQTVANRVARWNTTTQTWSAIITKDQNNTTYNGVNNEVRALAVYGTDLYVGGKFTTAGYQGIKYIARYNLDTQTWSKLKDSEEPNSDVYTIAVLGDDVYVGGNFTSIGGLNVNYIARWNKTSGNWYSLDKGFDSFVQKILVWGTDIYAGGAFHYADGVQTSNVAKWNGTKWEPLGLGVYNSVRGMSITYGDTLTLGNGAYIHLYKPAVAQRSFSNILSSIGTDGSLIVGYTNADYKFAIKVYNGTKWSQEIIIHDDSHVMYPTWVHDPSTSSIYLFWSSIGKIYYKKFNYTNYTISDPMVLYTDGVAKWLVAAPTINDSKMYLFWTDLTNDINQTKVYSTILNILH